MRHGCRLAAYAPGRRTPLSGAIRIWKQLLADYEQPPLDPAIDEELTAFVARRTAEGGAPAA